MLQIINNTIIIICSLLFIFLNGCKPPIPYEGNKDLIGNWKGKTFEIITRSERVNFPMYKYGFASINFYSDSTYNYTIEITNDVILEKEVFGNPYAKTIINSGYKMYKSGYYLVGSSKIILYDVNKLISQEYEYYFNEQTFNLKFIDKDNKEWLIVWKK